MIFTCSLTIGDVWIASGNAIMKVVVSTGIISKLIGDGTYGFSGDGGAAGAAYLYHPKGVAIDSSGAINHQHQHQHHLYL